jgi:hypothetical protein
VEELELQEAELDKRKFERERLEREITKQRELEELRNQKILVLKSKEKDLAMKMRLMSFNEMTLNEDESMKSNIESDARAERYGYGKPKIPQFDGSDFTLWKIEVECIIHSKMYPEQLISQTIRNSLKGQCRKILLTIRPTASSTEILKKLEDIYGTTQTEDAILQDFFNAKQEDKECTSDWALRLESIIQLAIETGEIPESKKNSLLKQRFWKGLKSEKLRNNTRVTYESAETFEILRRKARVEEDEMKRNTKEYLTVSSPASSEMTTGGSKPLSAEQISILQQTKMREVQSAEQMQIMKSLFEKMKSLEQELREIKRENREILDNRNNAVTEIGESDNSSDNRNRGGHRGRGRGRRPWHQRNYDRQSHRYSPQDDTQKKERNETEESKSEGNTRKKEPLN